MNKMLRGCLIKGLLITGIALGAVCCKTKEMLVSETPAREEATSSEWIVTESGSKRDITTIKFRNIDGKIIINGVSENVKGNMALYRDSIIVISVIPALGYELIRILCTPDSIIVINRQERNYIIAPIDQYLRQYRIPVTFTDIQAILFNEAFYYKDKIQARTYKISIDTTGDLTRYTFESNSQGNQLTNQNIYFHTGQRTVQEMSIIDFGSNMRMDLNYDEFIDEGSTAFPRRMEMRIYNSNNTYELELNYGRVIFDDQLNVELGIPANYTRTGI